MTRPLPRIWRRQPAAPGGSRASADAGGADPPLCRHQERGPSPSIDRRRSRPRRRPHRRPASIGSARRRCRRGRRRGAPPRTTPRSARLRAAARPQPRARIEPRAARRRHGRGRSLTPRPGRSGDCLGVRAEHRDRVHGRLVVLRGSREESWIGRGGGDREAACATTTSTAPRTPGSTATLTRTRGRLAALRRRSGG